MAGRTYFFSIFGLFLLTVSLVTKLNPQGLAEMGNFLVTVLLIIAGALLVAAICLTQGPVDK